MLKAMPSLLRNSRSRLLRAAALVVIAAQAVAVCVAPSAEAVASRDAPAHVEPAGTHLHHSHTPETCPACLALQIAGVPAHRLWSAIAARVWVEQARPHVESVARAARTEPKTPRAPPLPTAVA